MQNLSSDQGATSPVASATHAVIVGSSENVWASACASGSGCGIPRASRNTPLAASKPRQPLAAASMSER
eukprot:1742243-Pyramimonas_sp.AAC.1